MRNPADDLDRESREAQIAMERRIRSLKAEYRRSCDEKILDDLLELTFTYIERFPAVDEAVPYLRGEAEKT
jgi:hypothetical protein